MITFNLRKKSSHLRFHGWEIVDSKNFMQISVRMKLYGNARKKTLFRLLKMGRNFVIGVMQSCMQYLPPSKMQ